MTSAEILAALERHYSLDAGFVFMREVMLGRTTRRADAIAMQIYRSRGIGLHGFEVKVDRRDWLRELRQAAKADELAARCLYWWIAAPAGLIPVDEVPDTWGLVEVSANGHRVSVARRAPRLDPDPLDLGTIALLFRRGMAAMRTPYGAELARQLTAEYQRGFAAGRDGTDTERFREEAYDELVREVREFEAASGLSVRHSSWASTKPGELGRAVKFVLRQRDHVEGARRDLRQLAERIQRFADQEVPRMPTFEELVDANPEAAA
jgi:hypothetical protein